MSIQELFKLFCSEQKMFRNVRPTTLTGYEAAFKLLMSYTPSLVLADITTPTIKNFFIQLNETSIQRDNKELRASTIATYRGKLNTFFNWLQKNGHIQKNPFDDIPHPIVEYTDKRFLDGAKVEKILNTISHGIDWKSPLAKARNEAIFLTLLYTGVRRSELLNLRLSDVDLQKRSIFVNGATSKSRRNRQIPLHPKLAMALETYIQLRMQQELETPFLFVSTKKDHKVTLHGLKHLVEKVKRSSGVHFHPHQWRHTFAINLLHQGTDIAKLRQLLGHIDIKMTAQYLREIPQNSLKSDIDGLNLMDLL